MKKIFAFTLAEVVLVMGIIGVVAMLTITNAKKDTDVAARVAQLRRCDEIISAAYTQAVAENGEPNHWGTYDVPTDAEVWSVLSQYLKLQKNCGTGTGCWRTGDVSVLFSEQENMKYPNIDSSNQYQKGILSNGASFALVTESTTSGHFLLSRKYIIVDVDGPNKGNYRLGDDVFGFEHDFSSRPLYPLGYTNTINASPNFSSCIGASGRGINCTAWVLKFGNMDYLKKCRDELNWENGPHTCRD